LKIFLQIYISTLFINWLTKNYSKWAHLTSVNQTDFSSSKKVMFLCLTSEFQSHAGQMCSVKNYENEWRIFFCHKLFSSHNYLLHFEYIRMERRQKKLLGNTSWLDLWLYIFYLKKFLYIFLAYLRFMLWTIKFRIFCTQGWGWWNVKNGKH